MTEQQLPQQINVLRLAEQGAEISGHLPINKMSRLKEMLVSDAGEIAVTLELGKDKQRLSYLQSKIAGELILECQRCLKPVTVPIEDSFMLSPIEDEEEANHLPSHYEPLLIDRDQQFLSAMIEDELILRLPIVPLHDTEQCKAKTIIDEIDNELEETGKNPFDILSELK
jgi:uncharacterized protein